MKKYLTNKSMNLKSDAKVRRFSARAKKKSTFFIDLLRHRPRSATESGNEPFSMSQTSH